MKMTDLIKQSAGTAHIPIFNLDHKLLGYVRLAYKFVAFYPSLMREFTAGWREIAFEEYRALRKGGLLKAQCVNDFSSSIPFGVLTLSLLNVKNLQDFIAKVKHDVSLPLILVLRLNGQVKYIWLKEFEHNRRAIEIYFQTISHNDRLEFELVQPKSGSKLALLAAESEMNLNSLLKRLHSSNSLSSNLKILKHE